MSVNGIEWAMSLHIISSHIETNVVTVSVISICSALEPSHYTYLYAGYSDQILI